MNVFDKIKNEVDEIKSRIEEENSYSGLVDDIEDDENFHYINGVLDGMGLVFDIVRRYMR